MVVKESWFIYSIFALVLWGLWGFFPKLATYYINPMSILIYEVIGTIVVGCIVLVILGFSPEVQFRGVLFGLLTGITLTLGSLFFLFALNEGKTSVVVTMTALYPLITILLAFLILKEQITLRQGIAIILALVAMVLFSS